MQSGDLPILTFPLFVSLSDRSSIFILLSLLSSFFPSWRPCSPLLPSLFSFVLVLQTLLSSFYALASRRSSFFPGVSILLLLKASFVSRARPPYFQLHLYHCCPPAAPLSPSGVLERVHTAEVHTDAESLPNVVTCCLRRYAHEIKCRLSHSDGAVKQFISPLSSFMVVEMADVSELFSI